MKPIITVIDAIMGAGKTLCAHRTMNSAWQEAPDPSWEEHEAGIDHKPRFLYVTPFLSEVTRAKEACPDLQFEEPRSINDRPKWLHFERLLQEGENIATTHALLPYLSDAGLQAIREHGYRLVIDEALEGIDLHSTLRKKQKDHLIRERWIDIDPVTGAVTWKHQHTGHRFEDIERLAKKGSLFLFNEDFLIWEFPRQALDAFTEISVLTYLFEGSTLCAYLSANEYPYQILGINKDREIVARDEVSEADTKADLRKWLSIYEGPKNEIGGYRRRGIDKQGRNKFTMSNLHSLKPEEIKTIAGTVTKFIQRDAQVSSREVAWTTFKEFKDQLRGKRYANEESFIPINARASNDWRHKTAMIYLANRFPNPVLTQYIKERGQEHCENMFALSEMLQWLWRGCIRDDKPMQVFVPAERMRNLLYVWLDSNTVPELRARISLKA